MIHIHCCCLNEAKFRFFQLMSLTRKRIEDPVAGMSGRLEAETGSLRPPRQKAISLSPIHKPASSSPRMASHQNMQMPFELCILVCRSHDRLMMHYVQLLLQTQSIIQPQSTNILRPASHQNTFQSTCIDVILDRLIFHTCMLNAVISPLLNSKRDPLKINLLLDLVVF